MAKKLMALSEYRSEGHKLHFRAGDVIAPDDALYLYLMADAPDCFEMVTEPLSAAIDVPPSDKMLRAPKAKK